MNQKIENSKNWMKEHKKELLIGTLIVVTGGVSVKLLKDVLKATPKAEVSTLLPTYVKMDIPEGLTGMLEEISAPRGETRYKDLWIDELALSDLGKFGEELMKLDYFDENSYICGVVSANCKEL